MKSFTRVAVICAILTSGCANNPNMDRGQTGAAIGAVAGAVFGHQIDGEKGRFLGAAVGAVAGHAVGRYMDEQQRELDARLQREQAADAIRISRMPDDSLKLNLDSKVSFDVDSAAIKVNFQRSLDKIAVVLADYPLTAIHISGHTDSTGSDRYNQQLSVRRAQSVSRYLTDKGVEGRRTRIQGYGETRPVSDNNTAAGRQRNRRVEILLKPIVQGDELSAFQTPA